MGKYRKKSIVVDAVQFNLPLTEGSEKLDLPEGMHFCSEHWCYELTVLGGDVTVHPGDWIVTGVKGEKSTCSPDVFAETHELVDDHPMPGGMPVPEGYEPPAVVTPPPPPTGSAYSPVGADLGSPPTGGSGVPAFPPETVVSEFQACAICRKVLHGPEERCDCAGSQIVDALMAQIEGLKGRRLLAPQPARWTGVDRGEGDGPRWILRC